MSARIAAAGWSTRPPARTAPAARRRHFVCGFHGWTFNLDGKNTYILDKDDWKGALDEERTSLCEVKVDTWGGWIFINMDPDCRTLARISRARRRAFSIPSSSRRCVTSGGSG